MGLVRDLKQEVRTLIQQQLQLARTEISEKVRYFGRNGVALAIGGAVAYAGLIVVLLAAGFLASWIINLAGVQSLVASFLGLFLIGLLVTGIGAVTALKGVSALRRESLAPERTLHTLQRLRGNTLEQKPVAPGAPVEPRVSSEALQTRVEAAEGEVGKTLEELGRRMTPGYLTARLNYQLQEHTYSASLLAAGVGLLSGVLLRKWFRA